MIETPSCVVPLEGALVLDLIDQYGPELPIQYFTGEMRPVAGGLNEIFPSEGLNRVINLLVRNLSNSASPTANTGAIITTHYLGLYTAPAIGTMPNRAATLTGGSGGVPSGTDAITECSGGGYARASIASTDWPPVQDDTDNTGTSGRESRLGGATGGGSANISFATSTGSGFGTVTGFFLASNSGSGGTQNNGYAIFYANFSDGQSIVVNTAGYTIRLAPFIRFDH